MQSGFEEPSPSEIALAPRARVLLLARRIGEEAVADWCAELLSGSVPHDDRRRPSIKWLGGRHAEGELKVGRVDERGQDYWPRVWAARGLLHIWRPTAEPVLTHLLDDRVRRVRAAAEAALTESARPAE